MGNSCSRVFCCCCGRSRYEQADAHTQPLAVLSPTQNTLADVLERSIQARSAAWAQLGKARPIPTTHLKASANSERQKWPSVRQSYQLVERGNGTTILASDGLSDPFDDITLGDGNVNGFGLEFFIECPTAELDKKGEEVVKSWQFQLLYTVSQLAAGHGGIRSILDDMKLLSTEAEGVNEAIPESLRSKLVNDVGRVGALLGLQAPQSQERSQGAVPPRIENMPLTEVLLVNIKLLTLSELRLITDKGTEGRRQLSEAFAGPDRLVSSLHRAPLV